MAVILYMRLRLTVMVFILVIIAATLPESSNNPIGVYANHLVLTDVVTIRDAHAEVDKDGFLKSMGTDSTYTSFSLDVGFNKGQTSLGWHAKQKNIYIIGIEANSHLVQRFEHIQEFTSIINQPNSAILSVGAIIQKPVVKNGNIVIGNTVKLTLASDHRVVDGATGAKFLQTLRKYIENPLTMVL